MNTKDITTREDIYKLVVAFYNKVREDAMLASIFNNIVLDWDEHYEIITTFWEANLFGTKPYKGNPIKVHQNVDEQVNNSITMSHFGTWLNLWFETIDSQFKGEIANMAKRRARKMTTFMFMSIYNNRPS